MKKTNVLVLTASFFFKFTLFGATYYLNSSPGPYPFDPYDGLMPVTTLNASSQIYRVEDTPEDYAALQNTRAAFQAQSLNISEIESYGGPMPHFADTDFYLKSLVYSNSTLTFRVHDLNVGDDFLICRKKALDDNFTNYWLPEWQYQSPATDIGLQIPIPADSTNGFYRFVDYSQYNGPTMTITEPADNSVVSGMVQVKCLVTDIFQPLVAELYIDGNLYKKVTSGPISFDVDTTTIANGSHNFTMSLSSLIPSGTNSFENESTMYLTNLVTSNSFAAVNMPQAFTASLGAIPYEFQTMEPAICSLVIMDTNGMPLRTLWATNSTAGTLEMDWDLTDDNGSPVDTSGSYLVSATAYPQSGGGAHANATPPPWNIFGFLSIHHGLHAGYTSVFRAALTDSGDESWQESLADYISGAIYDACTVHPTDFDGYDRTMDSDAAPKIFNNDGDLQSFFAVTTNSNRFTGHVIWIGHASPSDFGPGHGTYITEDITEEQIKTAYGNGYNEATGVYWFGVGGKRGRIRYVEIDGCDSASDAGDMCVAFGTPKAGVDGNPNLERSTYCGWRDLIYLEGGWPFRSTAESRHVKDLQAYWSGDGIDTPGIDVASVEAFYDEGDDSYISVFRIEGSHSLTWQN